MKSILYNFTCLYLAVLAMPALATTIAPYQNLALMGQAADAVVTARAVTNYQVIEGEVTRYRTTLQVIAQIKGHLESSQTFELQNHHVKIGEYERTIWGDLELVEGETYLLFLSQLQDQLWQGQMLSYAAFHEMDHNGDRVMVPIGLGTEVHIVNREAIEALGVYYADPMIELLRSGIKDVRAWDQSQALSSYTLEATQAKSRAATPPGHCTFLAGGPNYGRWDGMETTPLPIRAHVDGDAGCANASNHISTAVNRLNSNYQDMNVTSAGTHNFNPSCQGQGSTDGEFTSWISSNLGGSRHILIQFDDPCNEIQDLIGCNGTIAFGGMYWSSQTYTANGETWRYAAYGHVMVNNGAGNCLCGGNYVDMITHELGHALNSGHISGRGTANMNPSCCVDISSLDQECFNFMYSSSALPVEVVDFWGAALETEIELEWQSASEYDNDFFTIERLIDTTYIQIGTITGAGNSVRNIYYSFYDKNPAEGINYYRLLQTDFDGSTRPVKTIAIPYFKETEIAIAPNPVRGSLLTGTISTKENATIDVSILDAYGHRLQMETRNIAAGANHLSLSIASLSPGMYQLEIRSKRERSVQRFLVQ